MKGKGAVASPFYVAFFEQIESTQAANNQDFLEGHRNFDRPTKAIGVYIPFP